MDGIDRLLDELQAQFIGDGGLDCWKISPFMEEHELLQGAFALLAQRRQLKAYSPKLVPAKSGAVPLFHKSFFPWGPLPYPKEHAQLGALLAQLNDPEMRAIAQGMVPYQQATLDHTLTPIAALFRQEGHGLNSALREANTLFFESLSVKPAQTSHFSDECLGLVAKRDAEGTLVCTASGCKSGMGTFLYKDAGILNYGPQGLNVGNCSGFGLAGLGQKIRLQDDESYFSLSYLTRLAAPSGRRCAITQLNDSDYSASWMEAALEGGLEGIANRVRFEGLAIQTPILFSFFGKGEVCTISGLHQLRPRSLDRYQGPPDTLLFSGQEGSVRIGPLEGSSHLEVIPLAGDESFWGADFLATFTVQVPETAFVICRV